MNSKSPDWTWSSPATAVPSWTWVAMVRDAGTPAVAQAACTSLEQSNAFGPVAPCLQLHQAATTTQPWTVFHLHPVLHQLLVGAAESVPEPFFASAGAAGVGEWGAHRGEKHRGARRWAKAPCSPWR
jgi:hypothetical protein